jgi:hypothetical protein
MITFELESMDAGYHKVFQSIKTNGRLVQTRGFECVEIRPAHLMFSNPRRTLYSGKSRKMNYRFWAIESLTYLSGMGCEISASLLCHANKGMKSFVNPDTGRFDGAYGPRLTRSYERIVQQLKDDPDSRQCVASIWEPGLPVPSGSKDVPCTLSLQFFTEVLPAGRRKLSMMTHMRSNDINWGFPYDVPAFAAIQIAMASALGLEPGPYYHSAGSLHYYKTFGEGGPKPPTLESPEAETFVPYVTIPQWSSSVMPWSELAVATREMLREIESQLHSGIPFSEISDLRKEYPRTLQSWHSIIKTGKPYGYSR